jgi:Rod binding domain-containing protein
MELSIYRNLGVSLNRPVASAGKPLVRAGEVTGDNLKKRVQEFEAVLVEQMLKAVQPRTGLFGKGFQGDFYQSFFLQELAAKLAEHPGLGLAASIYRTLKTD